MAKTDKLLPAKSSFKNQLLSTLQPWHVFPAVKHKLVPFHEPFSYEILQVEVSVVSVVEPLDLGVGFHLLNLMEAILHKESVAHFARISKFLADSRFKFPLFFKRIKTLTLGPPASKLEIASELSPQENCSASSTLPLLESPVEPVTLDHTGTLIYKVFSRALFPNIFFQSFKASFKFKFISVCDPPRQYSSLSPIDSVWKLVLHCL